MLSCERQHLTRALWSPARLSLQPHAQRQGAGQPQILQRHEDDHQSSWFLAPYRHQQRDPREACPLPGGFLSPIYHVHP